MNTNISEDNPAWRGNPPTGKQINAISNMRRALGSGDGKLPTTKGEACDEISKLKAIIRNNLVIGGSINARHSVYSHGSDWDDFEGAGW